VKNREGECGGGNSTLKERKGGYDSRRNRQNPDSIAMRYPSIGDDLTVEEGIHVLGAQNIFTKGGDLRS